MVYFGRCMLVLMLLMTCAPAYGTGLNGRLTTSFYSWESGDTDSTSSMHLRAYQAVRLNVNRIAGSPASLRLYLRGTHDPDARLTVYHTYMDWTKRGLGIRTGRQAIYAGVGVGTIDGVRLTYRGGRWRLVTYAGAMAPVYGPDTINGWSDAHMMGAYVTTDRLWGTRVGLSFARRNRTVTYHAEGRYTLRQVQTSSLEGEWVGIDASRRVGRKLNLYGRLDFDVPASEVRRGECRIRWTVRPDLNVTGEFVHRTPNLSRNDVLRVFGGESNREVSLRGTYRIGRKTSLWGNLAAVLYEGDTAHRIGLGISLPQGSLGYVRRDGYGGESDGLSADILHPLTETLSLRANLNVSSYRLFPEAEDRDEALGTSVGLKYRPTRHLSLDLEAQNSRNRIYDRDTRLFARVNIWFFRRGRT